MRRAHALTRRPVSSVNPRSLPMARSAIAAFPWTRSAAAGSDGSHRELGVKLRDSPTIWLAPICGTLFRANPFQTTTWVLAVLAMLGEATTAAIEIPRCSQSHRPDKSRWRFTGGVGYGGDYANHGTEMSQNKREWRDWPVERREREYSPSRCVDALAPLMSAYAARSRDAEQRFPCQKDLRWGETGDETFDFFPAARPDAPLLLFIHGGYWQELSKNESLFPAPACVTNGIAYAALNYTLAPKARLESIVKQCRRAVAYFHREARALGFDARRLYVAGSSAGAHLAAMLLVRGWQGHVGLGNYAVAGAVLLSVIYDIEPLIGTYIDEALHLTVEEAELLSPMRLPPGTRVPVVVAWGEHETCEFKRQSRAYASRIATAGFRVCAFEAAGANHFDLVFGLADQTSPLGRATLALIRTEETTTPGGPRGASRQT